MVCQLQKVSSDCFEFDGYIVISVKNSKRHNKKKCLELNVLGRKRIFDLRISVGKE